MLWRMKPSRTDLVNAVSFFSVASAQDGTSLTVLWTSASRAFDGVLRPAPANLRSGDCRILLFFPIMVSTRSEALSINYFGRLYG